MPSSSLIGIAQENTRYTAGWKLVASMPFIYGMIVPVVVLDVGLEIYHRICFSLYGIPLVKRSRYIKVDRHRLEYLTLMSKLHCLYCGYVNGLFHYASVIAAATELYWCPIQHEQGEDFKAPRHHRRFAKYGEIKDLQQVLATDRTNSATIERR